MSFSIFRRRTDGMPSRPEVLVITQDDRFICALLYATDYRFLQIRWAKSVETATCMLEEEPADLIIYDWRTDLQGWESGLLVLSVHECQPTIILAVPELDEAIWRRALEHGAYDAVPRSRSQKQLLATMRFALDHKRKKRLFALNEEGVPAFPPI